MAHQTRRFAAQVERGTGGQNGQVDGAQLQALNHLALAAQGAVGKLLGF